MAKQINKGAALYDYISFFNDLWKDNYSDAMSEPFISITEALADIEEDNRDKKDKNGNPVPKIYDVGLRKQTSLVLNRYRDWAEEDIPEGLEQFVEELNIKKESSAKNFRAQWVVGWGKYRRNFDAAFTLAAVMAICCFRPELLDLIKSKGSFRLASVNNTDTVTRLLMDKLVMLLPRKTLPADFRNVALDDEECMFRVLFFGTLYIIADSDTDNSLYDNNLEYAFRDKFLQAIKNTVSDFAGASPDYARYFTALYNHTRYIRASKNDRASIKKVEEAFVTPDLQGEWDNSVRHADINVIMGETGLGKSSLLYALASACLYDKVADPAADGKKFAQLRRSLQKLTNLPLADVLPVYFYATSFVQEKGLQYHSVNQFAYGSRSAAMSADLETLVNSHNGPVLFLVDAIDEMKQEDRPAFMAYLRRIAASVPQVTLLITSRNINARVFDALSPEVNLLKMTHSDENIRKIISNYIRIFEKQYSADDFYNRIKANSYMKDILRNPYQIQKTISSVGSVESIQPVLVYDSLITHIVEDKWGDIIEQLDSSAIVGVLRSLACTMLNEENTFIPAKKIASVLDKCAKENRIQAEIDWSRFSETIAVRSGLLLYDDINNGFTFMTGNFTRFLAAQWIYQLFLNRCNTLKQILEREKLRLNHYMVKGELAACLERYPMEKENVTMLFFVADRREKGADSKKDTVGLLMELLLENAILYGSDLQQVQLAQLLKEDIPHSDLGTITLENRKNYHLVEKLQ